MRNTVYRSSLYLKRCYIPLNDSCVDDKCNLHFVTSYSSPRILRAFGLMVSEYDGMVVAGVQLQLNDHHCY